MILNCNNLKLMRYFDFISDKMCLRETKIAALWSILFGVLLETGLCLAMIFTIFRNYPLANRIANSILISLSISNVVSWILFFNLLQKYEKRNEEKMLLENK